MRKREKDRLLEIMDTLLDGIEEVRRLMENAQEEEAMPLLADCQGAAIAIGNAIEQMEGTGTRAVGLLEELCELIYRCASAVSLDGRESRAGICGRIESKYTEAREELIHGIKGQKVAVFLPYKVSMWDSLESIWKAATEAPDCEAYVIPIPYYDRAADGRLAEMHYEGNQYPEYVPVTGYDRFDFRTCHPDMIFIHNPYDATNYVTSIHPFFYSENLKKYTDCLVYIPYFCTSGGMSGGQYTCPAYFYADYIVIQSEKYRKFYDARIPDKKFLAYGSPKYDSIIHKCINRPEPLGSWKKKMDGKKVYFYNTSLGGMLGNTEKFLKKMEYVFQCFRERDDACLLWRPHPLMEVTIDSIRKDYRLAYDNLKKKFIQEDWGIFDDTPDIGNTIALCDAYIGDEGTSVISLFGITGKPIFVLDNGIHQKPSQEDWRGEIITGFRCDGYDEWKVTQGNKLYRFSDRAYKYEYYCDLSEYTAGGYYASAMEVGGRVYVCPVNAQDILVVKDREIKKIKLKRYLEEPGAFYGSWKIGNYIFLVPNKYPEIVRLDTRNEEISYIKGVKKIFAKEVNGEYRIGGNCVWRNYLMLASPTDNQVAVIDSESLEIQILTTTADSVCGCLVMVPMDEELWLLPFSGKTVVCWKPDTGEAKEYSNIPEKFRCINRFNGCECTERPFGMAVLYKNMILLSPGWGNMFLLLNKDTGEFQEWMLPFEVIYEEKSGYFPLWSVGTFLRRTDTLGEWTYRYYDARNRKLYDVNLETREYREILIEFNKKELDEHAAGFGRASEWLMYGCTENAFNSLTDFLDGHITGKPFNKESQMEAYQEISADNHGTCGERIYKFVSADDNSERI